MDNIPNWNDATSRTKRGVVKAFRRAVRYAEKQALSGK